jgi:hypothetical protein
MNDRMLFLMGNRRKHIQNEMRQQQPLRQLQKYLDIGDYRGLVEALVGGLDPHAHELLSRKVHRQRTRTFRAVCMIDEIPSVNSTFRG